MRSPQGDCYGPVADGRILDQEGESHIYPIWKIGTLPGRSARHVCGADVSSPLRSCGRSAFIRTPHFQTPPTSVHSPLLSSPPNKTRKVSLQRATTPTGHRNPASRVDDNGRPWQPCLLRGRYPSVGNRATSASRSASGLREQFCPFTDERDRLLPDG